MDRVANNPAPKNDSKSIIEEEFEKYNSANMQLDVKTWISSFMTGIELTGYYHEDFFEVYNEEFINFDHAQFKKCSDILFQKIEKNFAIPWCLYPKGEYFVHQSIFGNIREG